MSGKFNIHYEKHLILLYNNKRNKWEDKTKDINAISRAYYHGNFSGYNVYFKDDKRSFFYKKFNAQIFELKEKINPLKGNLKIGETIVQPIKIEKFAENLYRITTKDENFLAPKLIYSSNDFSSIYNYYSSLALYAGQISRNDEPLYYLSNNYKRIKPSSDSVLYDFFDRKVQNKKDEDLIIVPFPFNKSQFKAIKIAMNNNISVIEGPPGTGKTQTILNLLANILVRWRSAAVVSNNNFAIDNVYDKLVEENLDFLVAKLGNYDNVNIFFEKYPHLDNDLNEFLNLNLSTYKHNLKAKLNNLHLSARIIHERELKEAKLKLELNELLIEYRNFSNKFKKIKVKENLKSTDYLKLINIFENTKKNNWFRRIYINIKYKIKIGKIEINDLLLQLEKLYYETKIKETKNAIYNLNYGVPENKKSKIQQELIEYSKAFLYQKLQNHYNKFNFKDFNLNNFKKEFSSFLLRYPIILSTSQSLLNNIPSGFKFDYLIIDEASQGDLLSSLLAMSCAKNLIVLGDSKQLEQIEEERLFQRSSELAKEHGIPKQFRYEKNSILNSIKSVLRDVPITLLREHYRSVPDIISFCNKMFYDNELIPMRPNETKHLEIIKTVPGNHGRKNPYGSGMYNQREIDELDLLLKDKDLSEIGVITPFRYQAELIQNKYKETKLEASTIHSFQGRQKKEIILSFVANDLTNDPTLIENRLYNFLTNEKLLNVAISRGANKVTAIVSDKIYNSNNNIIKDFINYAEYLYGSDVTKESSVVSVFDYLYSDYKDLLINKIKKNQNKYASEILMMKLIEKTLTSYPRVGYQMHRRLSRLLLKTDNIAQEDINYLLHPWTHVDFLFFNKITKKVLFVVEVDGVKYHEQSEKQRQRDKIKDNALLMNGIKVHRFQTNEANEETRLIEILNEVTY